MAKNIEYKYLASNAVKIYPTALRGGIDFNGTNTIYDPESRLNTEFNITSSVNSITIDGSFVTVDEGGALEFCIKGYYIRILDKNSLLNKFASDEAIWANVRIKELAQQDYKLKSLVVIEDGSFTNLDSDKGFVGIGFSNESTADGENVFSLKLFEKVNNEWKVPHDSKLKVDAAVVKLANEKSLHDVIYEQDKKINIDADEFKGHLTGNVTGDLDGNAKTSTDSSYAAHIGTNKSHTKIGNNDTPVYVNSDGEVVACDVSVGSNDATEVQFIKVVEGKVVNSMKRVYSKLEPSNATNGFNNGDE